MQALISLPWLFFRDQRRRGLFPLVMGLHSGDIAIKTDDDRSTWSMPILTALGLSDHEFVTEVAGASTFAGCAWAGSGKIRLTGSEAYLGSVLPVRSALLQLEESLQPRSTYAYFQAALAIGLIVLDAPMIGVSVGAEGSPTLEKVTWQRLWRHEPEEELDGGYSLGVTSAIDIVHESFLTSYLDDHVMPFAREFASRVQRHHHEIATGKAFARGMGADSWSTIESRLEPRSTPIDLESVPERQTVPRTLLDLSRVAARKIGADLRLRIARRRARRRPRPPR